MTQQQQDTAVSSNNPTEMEGANFSIYCSITGIPLADVRFRKAMAGSGAYMKHWKESMSQHSLFSEPLSVLISKCNASWNLEKSGKREWYKLNKRIMFVALLHASDCIKQDTPGLPSEQQVETLFPRLFDLLCRKHLANSQRLQFPKLHIHSRLRHEQEGSLFASLPAWLDACDEVYKDWEERSRTRQREAKNKAYELALRNIRSAAYQDVSLKKLWNWIEAQVDSFEMDKNADLKMLFFAEEDKIHNWTLADLEELDEFIWLHCDRANSVSYEVNKRIEQLKNWLKVHNDAFEFVADGSTLFPESVGVPAPIRANFPNNAQFLIAQAKWRLANKPAAKPAQEVDADDL